VESRKETLLVGKKNTPARAEFMYVGKEGNTVAFTNHSLGNDLKFIWDFNDGSEPSKVKDPLYTYIVPGYYRVCLTAIAPDGTQNTHCERIFAGSDTRNQCFARFQYNAIVKDLTLQCRDLSLGNPDAFRWTFNGEGPFKEKNPVWNAGSPGFVKVHQTILNTSNRCRDDAFALINLGLKSRFKAAFGYVIDSSKTKANTYPVDFVGVSLGDAGKLKWDFGDGTYDSTTVNPVHVYDEPGEYDVCLIITNTSTGESDTTCETIYVGLVGINDFRSPDAGILAYPNPFSDYTQIEINLTHSTDVLLSVYDLMGRKVKTIASEYRPAGSHTYYLKASDLEAGNYYLILETNRGKARQMISLIR
jgi:PKD repeat protein